MEYLYIRNLINDKYDLNSEYLSKEITGQIINCEIQMETIECKIIFNRELTIEEKLLLDDIVEDSRGYEIVKKSKLQIMDEIFFTSDPSGDSPTQRERLIMALSPMFIQSVESAVNSGDWDLVRGLVYSSSSLTEADKNLILDII